MIKIYKVEKSKYYSSDFRHYNLILYTETEKGFGCGKVFEGSYSECMNERKRLLSEKGKVLKR